jgi:hypothetical protein
MSQRVHCGMQAVRREVLEEVAVVVGDITLVGSQPWPVGRGGSCELMIGVVASAVDDAIAVSTEVQALLCWIGLTRPVHSPCEYKQLPLEQGMCSDGCACRPVWKQRNAANLCDQRLPVGSTWTAHFKRLQQLTAMCAAVGRGGLVRSTHTQAGSAGGSVYVNTAS